MGRFVSQLILSFGVSDINSIFPKLNDISCQRQRRSCTGLDKPLIFQEVEVPRFQDSRLVNWVRFSVVGTGRLYPSGNTPDNHFWWRLSWPQCLSSAGMIMSMKNSNVIIGNWNRNFPTCSNIPSITYVLYHLNTSYAKNLCRSEK